MYLGFEVFIWQELIGFFMLVFGTLVYNEIIIIPVGFMKKNTKLEIERKERELNNIMARPGTEYST